MWFGFLIWVLHPISAWWMMSSMPVFWVESEAEAVSDTSRSPLPLEGAGFRDKRFHQRTHLAALMVPESHNRTQFLCNLPQLCFLITVIISHANALVPGMKMSICWFWLKYLNTSWNRLPRNTEIHGCHIMNPNDFSDALTSPLVPPWGWHL